MENELQADVLDLLIDAPSSFAALYGSLMRNADYPANLSVSLLLNSLQGMEERGLVRAELTTGSGEYRRPNAEERAQARLAYQEWLPAEDWKDPGNFGWDPIGLWYELTEAGRAEWRRSAKDWQQHADKWTLDQDALNKTVSVNAETLDVAEAAVEWWLSMNKGCTIKADSRMIETGAYFELRSGEVVGPGYRLVFSYDENGTM